MKNETKEQVAFMAASLINLADMAESDLREVVKLVGDAAIRELLDMERLRYEVNYEEMVEEICFYVDWEPTLINPCRTDVELSQIGHQIADLVEDAFPAYEDAAESLVIVLDWCGLGAWLDANNGQEEPARDDCR